MKRYSVHLYIVISIIAGRLAAAAYSAAMPYFGFNVNAAPYSYMGNVLYSAAACLVPAVLYFCLERDFSDFRKENTAPIKPRELILCIAAAVGAWCTGQFVNSIAVFFLKKIGIQPLKQISELHDTRTLVWGFITVCITAPVFEELLYRGVILDKLKTENTVTAAAVSALFFAFAHGSTTVFVMPLIYGFAIACAVRRFNNIKYGIIMHFLSNLAAWLLTVCNIPKIVSALINTGITAVCAAAVCYAAVYAAKRRAALHTAFFKIFAAFFSNPLWIIVLCDFILKNI